MKTIIIDNEYYKGLSSSYCIDRLFLACINMGIDTRIISGSNLTLNIDSVVELKPDFVIMRDKFPNIAKALEGRRIKVFNSADTLRICDDKAEMIVTLESNNLPTPNYIISPETYGNSIGIEFLAQAADILGYPMIVKKNRSSYGIGVSMVRNYNELLNYSEIKEPLVLEKFIPLPFGQDIRVFVIGNEVAGAIVRQGAEGEFRSNIELGGSGASTIINDNIKKLAINAINAVSADYGGVDIINADKPVVLEVNANAGFKCMDEINGIDIATLIINYIMEKIK